MRGLYFKGVKMECATTHVPHLDLGMGFGHACITTYVENSADVNEVTGFGL